MNPVAGAEYLLVIGPGRLGLALGTALLEVGWTRRLGFLGRSRNPPVHPVFARSAVDYFDRVADIPPVTNAILITVPDGSIAGVAEQLRSAIAAAGVPVMHTSGVHPAAVLEPLKAAGVVIGSIHPLATIADPVRDGVLLRGAWFGVEGEPAAVRVAEGLVEALQGRALRIACDGKAAYHAAAVMASNYVVAILAAAGRIMEESGVGAPEAQDALAALARGAVDNVAAHGVVNALTGPISRGDVATVEAHLARLSPRDGLLYSVLAQETLTLARARGLPNAMSDRLAALFEARVP